LPCLKRANTLFKPSRIICQTAGKRLFERPRAARHALADSAGAKFAAFTERLRALRFRLPQHGLTLGLRLS
jgi:hypothetical protein